MMTFEELAKMTAGKINQMASENGYSSFKEMKKAEMWDAADVKYEIADILDEIAGEVKRDIYIDEVDGTLVFIGWNEMKWGEFKKLVFNWVA